MAIFKKDNIFQKNNLRLSKATSHYAVLCLTILILVISSGAAFAKQNPRYASLVMDANTGMILSQRYADSKRHPASLVKMMTLVMAFDALENGRLSLRDRVVISRHAASMVPSKLNIPVGSSIRVEDAIYALVTKSANDVAVALGEKISGSESRFAVDMTRYARSIGMNNTRFKNASGLHHKQQVTTARDMAILSQHIIRRFPRYYGYFSTQKFTYRGKTYRNHNRLMESYVGMDGLKTGYISASGFNLAASAKRGNQRIIGIVFGGRTSNSRNAHMKQILDEGFKKLNRILVAKTAPLPSKKPMQNAAVASVNPEIKNTENMERWADLNPMLQNKSFQKLIGEGDYDPNETRRFSTGLMAIDAIKGNNKSSVKPKIITYSNTQKSENSPKAKTGNWSIQVGAYQSRVHTDAIIKRAQQMLSPELSSAKPIIVPLKTKDGWVFRGRLTGYTKDQAMRACAALKDCLPVSPQAQ